MRTEVLLPTLVDLLVSILTLLSLYIDLTIVLLDRVDLESWGHEWGRATISSIFLLLERVHYEALS